MSSHPQSTQDMSLTETCSNCSALADECFQTQSYFLNILDDINQVQIMIQHTTNQSHQDQIGQQQHHLAQLQHTASRLLEQLAANRAHLVQLIPYGISRVNFETRQLIAELNQWLNEQKTAQIGFPFLNKDTRLEQLHQSFDALANQILQLRTIVLRSIDHISRGPRANNPQTASQIDQLNENLHQLTQQFIAVFSYALVVTQQPDPIVKAPSKLENVQLRLLLGDSFGVKQQLSTTKVRVCIITEEDARRVFAEGFNAQQVQPVGQIYNNDANFEPNEQGQLIVPFKNMKLSKIAPRRGATGAKGIGNHKDSIEQQYALLFTVESFYIGDIGPLNLCVLSLPFAVYVHHTQAEIIEAMMFWQRAFGYADRNLPSTEFTREIPWDELGTALSYKFQHYTGATRALRESDLRFLSTKLLTQSSTQITFNRFAKETLTSERSFYGWFFEIMKLTKEKLLGFWNQGWLTGFISKVDVSKYLMEANELSFMLRFSDTLIGAVSIGFAKVGDDHKRVVLHLNPLTKKDLDKLSMAQRISTCPDLQQITTIYPNINKNLMINHFAKTELETPTPQPPVNCGYTRHKTIMVIEGGRVTPRSSLESSSRNTSTETVDPMIANMNPASVESLMSQLSASDIDEFQFQYGSPDVSSEAYLYQNVDNLMSPFDPNAKFSFPPK